MMSSDRPARAARVWIVLLEPSDVRGRLRHAGDAVAVPENEAVRLVAEGKAYRRAESSRGEAIRRPGPQAFAFGVDPRIAVQILWPVEWSELTDLGPRCSDVARRGWVWRCENPRHPDLDEFEHYKSIEGGCLIRLRALLTQRPIDRVIARIPDAARGYRFWATHRPFGAPADIGPVEVAASLWRDVDYCFVVPDDQLITMGDCRVAISGLPAGRVKVFSAPMQASDVVATLPRRREAPALDSPVGKSKGIPRTFRVEAWLKENGYLKGEGRDRQRLRNQAKIADELLQLDEFRGAPRDSLRREIRKIRDSLRKRQK